MSGMGCLLLEEQCCHIFVKLLAKVNMEAWHNAEPNANVRPLLLSLDGSTGPLSALRHWSGRAIDLCIEPSDDCDNPEVSQSVATEAS